MEYPENGFYYHYKHDPNGSINNYVYEVIGVARHTEIQDPDTDKFVIYRKIDRSDFYGNGQFLGARPLDMFLEYVDWNGITIPRFRKIEDQAIISELEKIRDRMYN